METNAYFWLGGGLVGLFGFVMLCWALLEDRSNGRRRCPKCWYDMSKPQGLRCPECGREATGGRALFKTRRRWKWALTSLAIMAGAGLLAIQPKVRKDGWVSVMPATLLILALDMSDPQWALDGLQSRVEVDVSQTGRPVSGFSVPDADALYDWQWRMIAHRCLRILDSTKPAAARRAAIDLLSPAQWPVIDDEALSAIQDMYWRNALDPDQRIGQLSILSLSDDRDDQRGFARLRELLEHKSAQVRSAAVTGMRLMLRNGSARPVPALLGALKDEDRGVRMLAMGALASHIGRKGGDTADAFEQVLSLLRDPDAGVREATASRLSYFIDQRERVIELLPELIRSNDEALRIGAFYAVESMENRPSWAVEAAIDALNDPSGRVRQSATWLLNGTTAEDLRPHVEQLRSLLNSPNLEAVQTAQKKLGELEMTPVSEP